MRQRVGILADVSVQPKSIFAIAIQNQAEATECTLSISNYTGHQSVCYDFALWFEGEEMLVIHTKNNEKM